MQYSGLFGIKVTIFFFVFVGFCYFIFKVNLLGGSSLFRFILCVYVCICPCVCMGGFTFRAQKKVLGTLEQVCGVYELLCGYWDLTRTGYESRECPNHGSISPNSELHF